MDNVLTELMNMFPMLNSMLAAGIMVFARLLGFIRFAPVFNRKEIPSIVKISLCLLFTLVITPFINHDELLQMNSFILSIVMNAVAGAIVGYAAQLILLAIEAGADMINMQMGLSSAMVLDPTSSSQVSILTRIMAILGILIFIHLGGVYWLFRALLRSFEIFPIYATVIPLEKLINMDYLIQMSSNVLYMGLQIASPVLLATLGQDIILGVISKTAPQVNVFQLSFLFKPVLGTAIMIWILPMLLNIITEYFLSYSNIF